MSDRVLRSIHIGVGGRGDWPVRLCSESSSWQPLALVDVHEENLAAAREKTGLGRDACFNDPAAAFGAVEADAAVICTPTEYHAPFSRQALEAGLHVLVEKGMTNSWEQAVSLVEAAQARDLCLCVAQNYRYRPREMRIQQILQSGEVGAVAFFDLIHHRHRPMPRTLDYPASVLWDMGCHHFDLMLAFFGLPRRVYGRLFSAPWSQYRDPAGVSAVLDWDSGLRGFYELTHNAQNSGYTFRMETEAGTLFGDQEVRLVAPGGEDEQVFSIPDSDSSEAQVLDAFYRYITAGEEPPISGRQNLAVMAICEALVRSHESGQAQEPARLLAGTPYRGTAGESPS